MVILMAVLLAANICLSVETRFKLQELHTRVHYGNYPSCNFPSDPRLNEDDCVDDGDLPANKEEDLNLH